MTGWNHDGANWAPKVCIVCGAVFTPNSGVQKSCTIKCTKKRKRTCGTGDTDYQYTRISGNWKKYFRRLCNAKRRAGVLTKEDCVLLLEKQEYKCALTGVLMTCQLKRKYKCPTNASIDRIHAGGSYKPENIQLVCTAVNSFRGKHSVDEFVEWCKKVARYAEEKERKEADAVQGQEGPGL